MTPPDSTAVVALAVAGDVPADALRPAAETLHEFGVRTVEITGPERGAAEGWRAVIVASTDATLPAALADALPLPVVRVPVAGTGKSGLALLQTADGGLPAAEGEGNAFATVAIGPAGAKNAALFVVSVLALDDERLRAAWEAFRARQTAAVLALPPPTLAETLPGP